MWLVSVAATTNALFAKQYQTIYNARMEHAQILEHAAEAILCIDENQRIILFNHAAERTFGYTAVEIVGQSLDNLLPQQFAQQHHQLVDTLQFASESHQTIHEQRIVWGRRKDGQEFPAEVGISRIMQADGSALLIAIMSDVTARLQAERALQQRNRELVLLNRAGHTLNSTLELDHILTTLLEEIRHLLDVSACSVWLIDWETNELVCQQMTDPHTAAVVGWRLPVGLGFAGWVIENQKSLIVPDAWKDPRHFRGIDEKTHIRIRSILTVPLIGKHDVIGVIQVVDVQAQRFLESDQILVESLSAFATVAIENARLFTELRETQARLVERERLVMLGQMAATIAHELRNPLMAIRMGVEYLLRDVAEDDARWRGAALMKTNMSRIDRLVEDILYVARTPQPRLMLGLLRPLMLEEVAHWQLTLAEKRIELDADLTADLPPLMIDSEQIARALANLIANSVDALTPGGKIWVSLYATDDHQVICLRDNGPGILPEHLATIFEPFFTTKSRGTGLGLSIVKRIITRHSGRIEAQSAPASGATFMIRLPMWHGNDDDDNER